MAFVSAQGYQPVYNPPVPFTQPIYGGLRVGISVHIQGVVPHHVNRFHVNFACGQHNGADVAFHFNPRWDGKDRVVFNSLQSGSWGHEEKKKDKFPFHKGGHFELSFFANLGGFQVNVNGSHFYDFNHRIPLERVDCVQVQGDVTIRSLSIVGGGGGGGPMITPSFPSAGGPMITPSFPSAGVMPLPGYPAMGLPEMGGPVFNPPVPYRANIPGGVSPKKTFVIRGFLPMGGQRANLLLREIMELVNNSNVFCTGDTSGFHINFVTVTGEIAFHFNVRLNEFTVVRNSFLGGSWGPEEREMSDNPFMPGQAFDISIRCGNGRYKVYVNGQPFCQYSHRFPSLHMITALEIDGNVALSLVQI